VSRPLFETHTHLKPGSPVAKELAKRMRKERPTMAGYDVCTPTLEGRGAIPGIDLAFVSMTQAPLVPLGNCPNVPSPCGHCWYCIQRGAK
jgi:hypothetical protein